METTARAQHPATCACPPCFGGHAEHWQREDALRATNAALAEALEWMLRPTVAEYNPGGMTKMTIHHSYIEVARKALAQARGDA